MPGDVEGPRWLDGRTGDGTVGLVKMKADTSINKPADIAGKVVGGIKGSAQLTTLQNYIATLPGGVKDLKVYIGSTNGRLYALEAATGHLLWQYPKVGDPPLRSRYEEVERHNASARGLPASAAIGVVKGRDAVIF